MLSTSDLAAIAVLAAGIGVANIARIARQQELTLDVWGMVIPAQSWGVQPRRDAPEIEEGRAWLDRKAAERERAFQQQQQAEERRDLRLERRLDADRRMERDRSGWPGR
jgi:hypothetical protein